MALALDEKIEKPQRHRILHPMSDLIERITAEPGKCGGKPCIRGMRIRVIDVLDLLSQGLSHSEILEELPDLEEADIRASILYARKRMDHTVIAV